MANNKQQQQQKRKQKDEEKKTTEKEYKKSDSQKFCVIRCFHSRYLTVFVKKKK